jgi:hypothetical protein
VEEDFPALQGKPAFRVPSLTALLRGQKYIGRKQMTVNQKFDGNRNMGRKNVFMSRLITSGDYSSPPGGFSGYSSFDPPCKRLTIK